MSVRVTFTLAGNDEHLSVEEADEIIRQAFNASARGKSPRILVNGTMVLEVDPTTWTVTS